MHSEARGGHDHSASAGASVEGVLVGRACGEILSIDLDRGQTVMIRVRPEVGVRLALGQRVQVHLDQGGRAESVQPIRAD